MVRQENRTKNEKDDNSITNTVGAQLTKLVLCFDSIPRKKYMRN